MEAGALLNFLAKAMSRSEPPLPGRRVDKYGACGGVHSCFAHALASSLLDVRGDGGAMQVGVRQTLSARERSRAELA